MEFIAVLLVAVLVNNFVLYYFVGICPFIGVSKQIDSAVSMGIAVTFVMTLTAAVTWLINNLVLIRFGLPFLEYVSYILVIASLVQFVEMFIKKTLPALYKTLGIFLPLIAVNCAAIPSELAESQLFGYEKGAFTGAHNKGYIGLIRQADGGTLFLDEIGEMPLMLQSRLLRVLQQRIVTPLGSTESYPVNIKLISATNRSLGEDIRRGYFRQDLYYRIAGLNVELPSLRERTDIEPLIRFVHQRLLRAEPGPPLSGAMLDLLARHPWPGNMRQLVHALQVGMAMADGAILEETHLPDAFFADAIEPAGIQTEPLSELVPRLYHANGRNISRTARAAGVSRNTVYKYLRTPAAG